jgi:DNA/RNA endonuclease YhcR with UshA esterase domain
MIMDDVKLLKIAVVTSIIGIFALFFITDNFSSMDAVDIDEVREDMVGYPVKIKGEITSFSENKGHRFLTVEDRSGRISVVIFSGNLIDVYLEEGYDVEVFGKVDEYKGKLEIIPKEITVL